MSNFTKRWLVFFGIFWFTLALGAFVAAAAGFEWGTSGAGVIAAISVTLGAFVGGSVASYPWLFGDG